MDIGCQLASIVSEEQQSAALKAMEPYIGYQYEYIDDMQGSFAYISGLIMKHYSDPENGTYTFHWWDEEENAFLEVKRGDNSGVKTIGFRAPDPNIRYAYRGVSYVTKETGYANFIPSEPNWSDDRFWEDTVALSLDENGSKGIPRGGWLAMPTSSHPSGAFSDDRSLGSNFSL